MLFSFFFSQIHKQGGLCCCSELHCKTTGTWHAPTPPSKHVGHGVWKVPCWVLGDKDYFCSLVSGRETSRKWGRWTLIRLSLIGPWGTNAPLTFACSFLKLPGLGAAGLELYGKVMRVRSTWVRLSNQEFQWILLTTPRGCEIAKYLK